MKITIHVRVLILLFLLSFLISLVHSARAFVHPGAVDDKTDLDYSLNKIQSRSEPWLTIWYQMSSLATGGPSLARPYINSQSGDADASKQDAKKAYANALSWYLSGGNVTYAEQAISVLNSWTILQGFNSGSDQDKLQAGWIGALFAPAAEIMRNYQGWEDNDKANVQAMFKRAYYPQLNTMSTWNGNVDLTQIDAMMDIAVFNEDEEEFEMAIERFNRRVLSYFYLVSDGKVPPIPGDGGNVQAFWSNPTMWVDGLTQETCRDNGHHTQYAMASALHASEVAWNQGVPDLYENNTRRFVAAMELLATQILTGNMQGTCSNEQTTRDLFDTWEIGFNHYHNRKGIDMPNTQSLILSRVRVNGQAQSDWNIFFESLTHGKLIVS